MAKLTAGCFVLIANAVLQQGRRQHVMAMQGGDFPVGNAIGSLALIESWTFG